jgi:uncharacterized protein
MIDVRKIAAGEGVSLSETLSVGIPVGFGMGEAADVNLVCRLTNTGEHFALEGVGKCCVYALCSRCLAPVELSLDFQIQEKYAEADFMGDDDFICISDKTIDLQPAAARNLFINLPMKPLCSPDCAGLCPKCGANLNLGDCSCGGLINEQFSELLQFFQNKEV